MIYGICRFKNCCYFHPIVIVFFFKLSLELAYPLYGNELEKVYSYVDCFFFMLLYACRGRNFHSLKYLDFVWINETECTGQYDLKYIILFGSFKIRWNGAKWSGMISLHHLPLYLFFSDLCGMKNLHYSIIKFPNSGMKSSFCSASFCLVYFIISKHNLRLYLYWWNEMEWNEM